MFFSRFARNLQRSEILLLGALLEKGAAKRRVILRTSKLVTMTGVPQGTLEKIITRLAFLEVVNRAKNGRNFEYRVSVGRLSELKQPTFPDRTSLSAQLNFEGFGRLPKAVHLAGEEKPRLMENATLEDLIVIREEFVRRARSRVSGKTRIDQLDHLIKLMRQYEANISGITVKQMLHLECDSGL